MTTNPTPESKPMVTFFDAVKMAFRRYAVFRGRSTRAEYWWWVLFTTLVSIGCSAIDGLLGSFNGWDSYGLFEGIFALATLLPGLAVTARRLHDIGRTGWWQLAWYALPIIAWIIIAGLFFIAIAIVSSISGDIDAWDFDSKDFVGGIAAFITAIIAFVIGLLVTLAVIVWAIVWMVRQGQSGPNRFGPDPRALDAPEVLEAA